MKYVSLDLETSSLEPRQDHILMVSMVVEDTSSPNIPVEDLPHFTCFLKWDEYAGQAYALAMNSWILDILSGRNSNPRYQILKGAPKYSDLDSNKIEGPEWVDPALAFLQTHFGSEKITAAGKNVGTFDLQFLPSVIYDRFRHRVLDPGSLFFDPKIDKQVPSFEECKKRAGVRTPVAHDAREDALDVIRLFRMYWSTK